MAIRKESWLSRMTKSQTGIHTGATSAHQVRMNSDEERNVKWMFIGYLMKLYQLRELLLR
jgi:hypothetical protein